MIVQNLLEKSGEWRVTESVIDQRKRELAETRDTWGCSMRLQSGSPSNSMSHHSDEGSVVPGMSQGTQPIFLILPLNSPPNAFFFAQIPTHFACRTNDDYHLQDQSRFGNQEITKEPQSELFINILNLCRRLPPLIWSLQPAVTRPSHRFRLCSDFTISRKCLVLKCAQPSLQIRSWLLAGLGWGLKFVKQSSSNPSNTPLMMSCWAKVSIKQINHRC